MSWNLIPIAKCKIWKDTSRKDNFKFHTFDLIEAVAKLFYVPLLRTLLLKPQNDDFNFIVKTLSAALVQKAWANKNMSDTSLNKLTKFQEEFRSSHGSIL